MQIPLLNIKDQHQLYSTQIEDAVLDTLRSGSYILGKKVEQFENNLAQFSGCKYGIGVANGTDALIIALRALDIGPGAEVITPSFTFAATAEAICLVGAKPVFVDINPTTFNIDYKLIESLITDNTRAIIPVHLYGKPANMDEIMAIAKEHDLYVIEDNAQALGARYKNMPTGCFGDLSCISFYPTKNLGACGDAGAIVTNSKEIAHRVKILRAHGMERRYYHDEIGYNSRLDEIQAAILNVKLQYLTIWIEKRNNVAKAYIDRLDGVSDKLILPKESCIANNEYTHGFHQFTIRLVGSSKDTNLRDKVAQELTNLGIGNMIYYPIPLHMQKAFDFLNYVDTDLPNSLEIAGQVLSLPIYPELEISQIDYICESLKSILKAQ